jgi:hypothetical protein
MKSCKCSFSQAVAPYCDFPSFAAKFISDPPTTVICCHQFL